VARTVNVAIRAARVDDVPAVLAVWAIARSTAAVTPDTTASVEGLLERDPDALLVAVVEGTVVGVLVAGYDGWRGSMYRLAVLPPFRRHGVGAALVDRGEARLRGLGCPKVTAIVGLGELDALAFWEALGYGRDHEVGRLVRAL
jgi:ribosomal protein S18 acetylase RimI-like enzyme